MSCGSAAAAGAGAAADQPGPPLAQRLAHSLSQLVQAHFLPLALLSALVLGASCPQLGLAAANLQIPTLTTFGIFIIQVRRRAVQLLHCHLAADSADNRACVLNPVCLSQDMSAASCC